MLRGTVEPTLTPAILNAFMNCAQSCFLSVVFLAMIHSQTQSVQGADFRAGEPFPDLVLPSASDGEPMSVRQFLGKKLVVQIFASW